MRAFLTLVDSLSGDHADVALDADDRCGVSDVGHAARRLFRDVGDRSGVRVAAETIYVDDRPVDPAATIADSPIRDGSVISFGRPTGLVPVETPGLLEIRVVAGAAAGTVHRVGIGSGELGSQPGSWVAVDDSGLPAIAAALDVNASARCWLRPLVPATVDGSPIDSRTEWHPGQQVTIGDCVLELAPYRRPDAALQPSSDGSGLDYNRPPRIQEPIRENRFAFPARPGEPRRSPLPWLAALIPVVGSVALMLVTGSRAMLLFALLSPVTVIANHLVQRRNGRRSYAAELREYEQHKASIEAEVTAAMERETMARRAACPDPAALYVIATGPRSRLWERRKYDPDWLHLRVGTADLPSAIVVDEPTRDPSGRPEAPRTLSNVPVTLPLAECGVIGFAGPEGTAQALGRWAVAQIATLHSPLDIQIVVLAGPAGQESWNWVRWLPHCRAGAAQGLAVLVGVDAESVGRRVAALLDMVDHRAAIRRDTGSAGFREPDVVVVLDGSRRLRSLPGVARLLRDGPAVGVYALCLDASERLLPGECRAVTVLDSSGLRVAQAGAAEIVGVRGDFPQPAGCERLARAMAPIRDVSIDEDDAALPGSSRLLEVLDLDPPSPQAIVARWGIEGRTTAAVIGESFDGPFAIDLRRDGPHGLIAGTTGAGKSELLQTIVAALAVANRPDAMTFVLVDYKGGSAFGSCVDLPHTVGMVTDLDEHLVRRALESLSAELRRREHLLAAAGAKDIEDYTRGAATAPGRAPLPRLLIVIDEFASMARDLPDFVTGVVNIAQRGRSLGIHLILATQRPGGVVSPEIRANTNLRIALRVTDVAESQDVINAPDSARISKSTPGRAFARLGHASLVPFQTSRVGGRRIGAGQAELPPPRIQEVGWAELAQPLEAAPTTRRVEPEQSTDLQILVAALQQAAILAGVPQQHSPWLPSLPDSLSLADLASPPWDGQDLRPAPYGLDDLPALQTRRTAALDLASFGHLLVAGAPRSGRSQLLRTIAGSLATHHSSADVHLYGLDCGNGALLPLARLPHCGAVVQRTEVERAVRLIRTLGEEVRRRQQVLAAGRWADVTEQRASAPPEQRLSHILLLLDRWEGFTTSLGELDAGTLTDEIFTLMREGASVGVHLVITGDRSLLMGRISTLSEEKIALRLADRADASLIGLRPRDLPEQVPNGRGFRSETGIEVQVALLDPDPAGPAQAAVLVEIAERARVRDADVPASQRPFRLGELPTQVSFADAWALRDPHAGPGWVLVGVGGDELSAVGVDLAAGVPAFAIGGPGKSGRSTLLAAMARSALESGREVLVLAPLASPLRALAGTPGVLEVFTGVDVTAEAFTAALGRARGRVLIVIDDAANLRDTAASGELRAVLRGGDSGQAAIALAGDPEDLTVGFSGWLVDARKARRGALLSPQNRTDGDLIGLRLERTAVGQPVMPGRALVNLGDGSEPRVVQVPL
ncbi:FtsK/SpoIIIE domain-containing protein [Actinoplanes sp. NPDC051851]|uniref:FtsK/SpoIIIE domain-containing protein n=1 Tax=Actinoplanes sp. NPDC051851 TaxID=3154753 RepID=UPI00344A595C